MDSTILSGLTPPTAIPGDSLPLRNKLPPKQHFVKRLKQMYDKRKDYEDRWHAIRDFELPYLGEFEESGDRTNPGRRRDLKIVHGVTWRCAQIFAAGVMSGLTPPSRQWFRFAFSDSSLAQNVEAQIILDERWDIVNSALQRSNFYDSVNAVYLELAFGQCPMAIFYDPVNGIRFQPMTIGTYALDTDGFGKVNALARKTEMTLAQIIDCFGMDSLPLSIQENAKNDAGLDKKYQVNWLVEPNKERLPGYTDNLNMPYRSVYWLENSSEGEYLYVGGFEEWAIPVARYLVNGLEPYGKGPGWFAEGDAKMLQVLKKDYLTAIELHVKPPMKAPSNLMNSGGINLVPGGITAVDDSSQQYVQPLFNVNLDLQAAQAEIQSTEDAIKRAYSADLFLMLEGIDNGRMTAREVMERTQEKLQQLGPVVERLQNEFLTVIITRVYNILDRSGAFPPVDEEMQEIIRNIKVDYISPLAQAQKMSGLVNIEQGLATVAQMAQLWPGSIKLINEENTIRKYFEMLGAPAVMLRSIEEVEAMKQQEAAEAARQQEMQEGMAVAQTMAPLADAAKNMTEAANDANPAMTSWMGVPGGWD